MANAPKSRRELLEQFVTQKPGDAFARYGLALECVKLGDDSAAAGHFHKLLESNPDYSRDTSNSASSFRASGGSMRRGNSFPTAS